MSGKRGAILTSFDCCINGAARCVTEHQDKRRLQNLNGVFQACNDVVTREVTGHAANKEVTPRCIKAILGYDAGIRTAENCCEGVLPFAKRFAFVLEIVPSAETLDVAGIAFHQPIERSV